MKYIRLLSLLLIAISIIIFASHVKADPTNKEKTDIIVNISNGNGNGAFFSAIHVTSLDECKTSIYNANQMLDNANILQYSYCYFTDNPSVVYQYMCENKSTWTAICSKFLFKSRSINPAADILLESE